MRWNKETVISYNGQYILNYKGQSCKVPKNEEYIINAIQKGIRDDDELIRLIMKKDSCDEIVAGLTLSGLMIKYKDYMATDNGHYKII